MNLDHQAGRKNVIRCLIFLSLIAILFTLTVSIDTVYADDGVVIDDGASILGKFSGIYALLRGIGLAGAVISLGVTGVLYITGNDQSAAKAKTMAVYICIAVAAMYLIPAFVKIGVNWGKQYAYTPPSYAPG